MIILGAGILTWYYTNAISRQSREKRGAQTAVFRRAQGEMPLPALDGFNSLKLSSTEPRQGSADTASASTTLPAAQPGAQLPPPELSLLSQMPLMPSQSGWGASGSHRAAYGHTGRKSADQLALERLLAGAAFARESAARSAVAGNVPGAPAFFATAPAAAGFSGAAYGAVSPGDIKPTETSWGSEAGIAPFLQPSAIASARAKVVPTRRFLLPKGAFIDCTLETAIDSTLPGMTTCITATDTFSSDGTVVLLERGTKLIGETRGQVQQGVARVFVLWTEARTPTGIVVPLDSPGADELGRSGLPGNVNRHFWDRFGAAILISTLDGAVQAAVQSASRGSGPIIYNPSGSESVVTDVLKNSVNIPPTITKANGDRVQVFVARDVDFRSVYELRSVATAQ
jgi:type IV secretion system protein VirB10